jgi:hypothetical protein
MNKKENLKLKMFGNLSCGLLSILLLFSFTNFSAEGDDPLKLKSAYLNKDEKKFIQNFPQTFRDFKSVFGWNDKADKPNILYSEAYDFINYFFKLSSTNEDCKEIIIKIAKQAKWEADGVNYFHINLVTLVENDKEFNKKLERLNNADINTFWHFYFDIENLVYSPKLYNILDQQMREKAMSVYNTLKKQRINRNGRNIKAYQIFDKDGYCNLRKSKSVKSDIIEKLENNAVITVLDNRDDWWFVQTKNGLVGFVHKSRINVK